MAQEEYHNWQKPVVDCEITHRAVSCAARPHVACAVDLGASSGRVVVGSYVPGEGIACTEVYRFENGMVERHATQTWDIAHILDQVKRGIGIAVSKYGATTVGIDTWGVDYGVVDAAGRLVADVVAYRDARTSGLASRMVREGMLDGAYEVTGIQPLDINTSTQLVADRAAHPNAYPRGSQLLLVPDLITYLLTGARGTEASIASTTQLMDARDKRWAETVVERLAIDLSLLPAIEPLGSDAGEIAPTVLGLDVHDQPPHVVRVCEHDTASALACIELERGDVFVSCGTWSLVGVVLDEPCCTQEALAAGFSNETGANDSTLLLGNRTGLWIAQQLKREIESDGTDLDWPEVARLARESGPAAFTFDTEDPSFAQPGDMAGKLAAAASAVGITTALDTGAMFRAVYESLASTYRTAIEDLERVTGEPCRRIRLIGGGSLNALLCQLVANACGKEVLAGPAEASALGNLMIQLVVQGSYQDLDQARREIAHDISCTTYGPVRRQTC